jgi:hypothetical protein
MEGPSFLLAAATHFLVYFSDKLSVFCKKVPTPPWHTKTLTEQAFPADRLAHSQNATGKSQLD